MAIYGTIYMYGHYGTISIYGNTPLNYTVLFPINHSQLNTGCPNISIIIMEDDSRITVKSDTR